MTKTKKVYRVILTRDCTESRRVLVPAASAAAANRAALELAGRYGHDVGPWEPDELSMNGRVYVGDPDEAEEITDPVVSFRWKDEPACLYPLTWDPQAYVGGKDGDWHGHWTLSATCPLDAGIAEYINYHMIEGHDREGRGTFFGTGREFLWKVFGDPTQAPADL